VTDAVRSGAIIRMSLAVRIVFQSRAKDGVRNA
jgi:hypothetical protein